MRSAHPPNWRFVMRPIRLLLSMMLAFSIVCVVPAQIPSESDNYGVGMPEVFLPKYLSYRTQQLASANPAVMKIGLGYVKGLSTTFIAMSGQMALDLESGSYNVTLTGLTPLQTYTVWLVNGSDHPLLPDTVVGLASVLPTGSTALLSVVLGLNLPLGFAIDRVVVTPGTIWGAEPLAAGSVNVFQKIFFRRLTLLNNSTGTVLFQETTTPPS